MMAFESNAMVAMADAALRGAAAAAVVGAGLWVLRARNVTAQKAAWTLVLAGAVAMPAVAPWMARQSWMPAWIPDVATVTATVRSRVSALREHPVEAAPVQTATELETVKVAPIAAAPVEAMRGTVEALPPERMMETPLGPQYPAPEMVQDRQRETPAQVTAAEIAWELYLAVAAALVLRLLCGLGAALEMWQEGAPVELPAGGRTRVHNEITSPVTIGSGILLPAEYAEWDEEKLRIVLAHEGEHVRQGDFYLQLAAGLYAAIFWFSPLGWWLKRKLSDLGEAISDGAAVRQAQSRASYAQILLEFAGLPFATQMGVAMARPGRMTERMERLLNETRFQQAFAGGRGRLLAAVVLAPVAIFAATAVVRVHAQQAAAVATQAPTVTVQGTGPVTAQAPTTGVSHPDEAPIDAAPTADAAPVVAPVPPVVTPMPPEPPAGTLVVPGAPVMAPLAPVPPVPPAANVSIGAQPAISVSVSPDVSINANVNPGAYAYSYAAGQSRDSYAVISKDGQHVHFNGDYHSGVMDKARAQAKGDFLWFTRDGKQYIVDDPDVVARIHSLYQPMKDLGEQMRAAGKRQREDAERQRAEIEKELADSGFNKAEFDREMAEFRAKQPEFNRQMAELRKEMANLSIPKVEVDPKQFEELKRQMAQLQFNEPDFDRKMAELSREMASLRIPKVQIDQKRMADLNARMSELTSKFAQDQAKWSGKNAQYRANSEAYKRMGEKMARMGDEMGKRGAEMGRMANEADQKVRGIIDESLKNGKAKPIQ